MGLFDRFKTPKWESEDAEVRLKGIDDILNSRKKGGWKNDMLCSIIRDDPSGDVRLKAIQNLNIVVDVVEDAALNDPDWRVRKEAIESIERGLESGVRLFPDEHYSIHQPLIDLLEKIAEGDSNSEIRQTASAIVNNPRYSRKALEKLHECDIKEIEYTVVDASKNAERKIVLTQNENFEYVSHPKSVEEILDYCFGGDVIRITYSSAHTDLVVEYTILDRNVAHPDKIPVEGHDFDRIITNENMDSQNLSRNANLLFQEDVVANRQSKLLLLYYLHTNNKLFFVKKDEKVKFSGHDLLGAPNPFSKKPDIKLSTDQMLTKVELEIRDIEFVCQKIRGMALSRNITAYKR